MIRAVLWDFGWVNLTKPEPAFYELACEMLAIDPSACVFLDDLGINLKPARAMAWRPSRSAIPTSP